MDISPVSSAVAVAATATATAVVGIRFPKILLNRAALASSEMDVFSPLPTISTTASGISPVDSVAPPPVRCRPRGAPPRMISRRSRRTRRRPLAGEPDEDAEFGGFFGDGDDGPFGGGGGGRGWGFGREGGPNWGEDSSSSSSRADGALEFVYEVLCWIALSNCVHFAYKKVIRGFTWGIGDPTRCKVQVPALITVC